MIISFIHQAIKLIPTSYKRKATGLILLLILGSLLDLFSLASFIPLIVLALDPARISANSHSTEVQRLTGLTNPIHLVIALTLLAVILTLIKTQVSVWITFRKASFAYDVASSLASKSLTSFFQIPFRNYSRIDYTREMNRISNLPITFANNILIPSGTIISESLIVIVLVFAIVLFDFYLFLFVLFMISPAAWVYFQKRKKIQEISAMIKSTYPKLLKHTLQSIEGLTEIRIFRKESFFKKRFTLTYDALANTFAKDHTIHTSAARTTEVIMAICIGVLVIYTVFTRKSAAESILLLSVYAGASFRMMPSFNRIFSTSLQIRTHEYVVHELSEMLERETQYFVDTSKPLPFHKEIKIDNLSFCFQGHPWVFKNASLSIYKGEKMVIIGKSGTGKTTFFMILMRFLNAHNGEILVDNQKLTAENTLSWQKLLGYVPQNPYILDASIRENIAFGVESNDIHGAKIEKLIHDLDLQTWVDNLPEGMNTIIGERGAKISGGQRQRLAIARALYHDAEILLLDEITNQLDYGTEFEVVKTLDNFALRDKTIILITHRPELWQAVSNIYELRDGSFYKVVADIAS